MCGIAGFVGFGNRSDLIKMSEAVKHRGPDGEGYFCHKHYPVHLAHRRLAIIDPEGGAQPMWSSDRQICVIFNGEIYNHVELKSELIKAGHKFVTHHSDTEVLLHGWREWGKKLPEKLNGMFAFAIWDERKRLIFLSRDRFGEKPLYWAYQKNNFYFASELKAITSHSNFREDLDKLALKKYFAYGFIPAPSALYKDCFKLRPGHWLAFDLQSSTVSEGNYWTFRVNSKENPPSYEEAVEHTRELLLRSVKKRLMSDVPLGVFLSGGLDSGIATAMMCKFMNPSNVETFSVGFCEPSFDETKHANLISSFLGTSHHISTFNFSKAKKAMGEIVSKLDEPMADPSLLPTYYLSSITCKNVKVALSGDGGDELFAGYDTFSALKIAKLYKMLVPKTVHKGLRTLANLLPISDRNMSIDFKIRRALSGLSFREEYWNPVWLAPLEKSEIIDLFHETVHEDDLYSEARSLWSETKSKCIIDKTIEYYANLYLTGDILTKTDRAAMMNGLEVRSIFLDNDLVDFTNSLPSSYKFDGRVRKKLLKSVANDLLPRSIIRRPKKGFGIPLKTWMSDINVDSQNHIGLNSDLISQMSSLHKASKTDKRIGLWSWHLLKIGNFI